MKMCHASNANREFSSNHERGKIFQSSPILNANRSHYKQTNFKVFGLIRLGSEQRSVSPESFHFIFIYSRNLQESNGGPNT